MLLVLLCPAFVSYRRSLVKAERFEMQVVDLKILPDSGPLLVYY